MGEIARGAGGGVCSKAVYKRAQRARGKGEETTCCRRALMYTMSCEAFQPRRLAPAHATTCEHEHCRQPHVGFHAAHGCCPCLGTQGAPGPR